MTDLPPVFVRQDIYDDIMTLWNGDSTSKKGQKDKIKFSPSAMASAAPKATSEWIRRNDYLYGCSVYHGLAPSDDPEELRNRPHFPSLPE